MANTLTNLIPILHQSVDVVSRELVGMIPAVTLNADAEQAAKDQTITYPVSGAASAADIAPAATGPDPSDRTVGNASMSITKSRGVKVYFTGEEQLGLGSLYEKILVAEFAQAMRTLANEVEADLTALYASCSRAYGTAATTPFGTAGDLTDATNVRKILVDNGAPAGDLQLVLGTAAGANLRGKQSQAHMQGGDDFIRRGVLLDHFGMQIRESGQIKSHTAGTNSSGAINNAGYAVGATTLTLASAGTGTILTGDVISHARDTANKYVVVTGDSDVSNGGTVVIQEPGIRAAITASNSVITTTASYTANMAFSRSAIHLVTRTPAMPEGGDAADDVTVVTDPVSGLAFQIAMYRQYRRVAFEVGLAWGVKAVAPRHMAILIG